MTDAPNTDDLPPLPETEEEYPAYIALLAAKIDAEPDMWSADQIAQRLVPWHTLNRVIYGVAKARCKITPKDLDAAIRRIEVKQKKEAEAAAQKQQRQEKTLNVFERFNLTPQDAITERTVTNGFLTPFTMDYGRHFTFVNDDGEVKEKDVEALLIDLQLSAADYGLTKKPFELKDKNFERALVEQMIVRREQRVKEVWDQIEGFTDGRDAVTVNRKARRMFERFFKNPALAEAVVRKVVWQVKRKLAGLPVIWHHVVFLYSAQGTGKTAFWTYLRSVIGDMSRQVDVAELVAEAQLDLYLYPFIDLDEISKADRADVSKWKSLTTKNKVARRVFYTQLIKEVKNMATQVGSTNVPISMVINDPTGMRRWIQLDVKPKDAEMRQHFWHEVAGRYENSDTLLPIEDDGMDWLGFWQSVDHLGPDPLENFEDEIAAQQEGNRARTRVEIWLENFEYERNHVITPNSTPPKMFQYTAKNLYTVYNRFEAEFLGKQPMAFNNWGQQFKMLIEQERVSKEWSFYSTGNRTLYTFTPHVVVPMPLPNPHAKAS